MDPESREVVREIERYLRTHPEAGDTVQGVIRWWLAADGQARSAEAVNRALNELVRLGAMAVRRGVDGDDVYVAVAHKIVR